MQKSLILLGLLVALAGLGWPWLSKLPFGRLPGDIVIDNDNFRFYFPITTMIIVSVVLSFIAWLLKR